ncbi:hypothetical protein BV898_06019 [Hypsibius exemplaris]|uniref:Uncharacterized protein n=1 Tax=Hypsibius exemplaris TaxID=2072580 RepID=A0A1W0WXS7_HYPEX|nr:hypothetical protein BV898_06019 [Hypsibius exemplaris]
MEFRQHGRRTNGHEALKDEFVQYADPHIVQSKDLQTWKACQVIVFEVKKLHGSHDDRRQVRSHVLKESAHGKTRACVLSVEQLKTDGP